jgi:tetratricopeptide (TPR) repeat protein
MAVSFARTAALAVAFLSLAGCAGGPRERTATADKPAGETDAGFETRVEAYARFAAGISLELKDDPRGALEEFHRSALADPSNESLVIEVARRLILADKVDQAVELLVKAAQRPDSGGLIHALLGQAYAQQGRTAAAIAANRKAVEKLPRALIGYQNLFALHLQEKKPKDALAVLNQAADLPDADPAFLVDLAELFARYSQVQSSEAGAIKPRVLEILDRAADQNPAALALQLKLADGYKLFGETAKATRLYLKLLERSPGMPTIREKLTEIYLRGGDTRAAVEQLKAIVRENPTNPQAHYFLGSIAYDDRNYAEAAESFERARLLNPNFPAVYYDLAGLKITLDQAGEALELIDKARERFGRNFLTEFYAGLALSRLKKYPDAVRHLTDAELLARTGETNRLTHAFYFQLGATHERNKDHGQAEKYFRKSLELAPDSAETLNYLGYMWADLGINLDEARAMIERAVTLEPKNAAYLDSLGWVLFRLNRVEEALPHILQAVELSEEPDPTLFDHLGDIYLELKQPKKAREAWRKSLEVEDNAEIRKKLRKLDRARSTGP